MLVKMIDDHLSKKKEILDYMDIAFHSLEGSYVSQILISIEHELSMILKSVL